LDVEVAAVLPAAIELSAPPPAVAAGDIGEDYDPAHFNLTAANAAAASV